MSTTDRSAKRIAITVAIIFVAITLLITAGMFLQVYGPGNMGIGFLTGGGITILAVAIAAWRLQRHPDTSSTLERAWLRSGDERDDQILTRSLAVVGLSAPLLTGPSGIALALGAPVAPIVAILNFALIGIFLTAFAVHNRRG